MEATKRPDWAGKLEQQLEDVTRQAHKTAFELDVIRHHLDDEDARRKRRQEQGRREVAFGSGFLCGCIIAVLIILFMFWLFRGAA